MLYVLLSVRQILSLEKGTAYLLDVLVCYIRALIHKLHICTEL